MTPNLNCHHLFIFYFLNIFLELGWWVSDGDERHHDEIRIGFGLVWRCVLDDSADVVAVSLLIILSTIYLVLLDPWFVWCCFVQPEVPLSAAETDLVGFRNFRDSDDSTKSNKRFDLLRIQSNVQDPGREVSRW